MQYLLAFGPLTFAGFKKVNSFEPSKFISTPIRMVKFIKTLFRHGLDIESK